MPAFESSQTTFGVGHSCFVRSRGDDQWWHVFHAKRDRRPGWRRTIFLQPMKVGKRGYPIFGKPLDAGAVQDRPSGETIDEDSTATDNFNYYGHHQYLQTGKNFIRLGVVPEAPVNDYRCGEKIVFSGGAPDNIEASVTIDFVGNDQARDAGILFRCSGASVGYDAQRGYFAGLIPKTGFVILGKTDGTNWIELGRANTSIQSSQSQELTVRVVGDQISVWHDGQHKLNIRDNTYTSGSTGLRVVDTDAVFRDIQLKQLKP